MSTRNGNGNLMRRLVSAIIPEKQRNRATAYLEDSAYRSGSRTSRALRRWLPLLGSPNRDYDKTTQKTLTARSHDAYKNQPWATAAIDRLKHNVVGTGVKPQSKIDYQAAGITQEQAQDLQADIERHFNAWADSSDCDLERESNFYSLQTIVLLSVLVGGDVIVNTPYRLVDGSDYGLKVQVIDGDRLSNPNSGMDTKKLVRGVEYDDFGAPVAYFVRSAHENDVFAAMIDSHRWERLQAFGSNTGRRRVLHVKDKKRAGQTRGIPFLAPVMELFKKLDRYSEAEIDAAITASFITILLKTIGGETGGFPSSSTPTATEQEKKQITLDTAAIIELDEGEDAIVNNPARPNSNYEPYVAAVLNEIAAALGYPLDFLRLQFNASFSAARAAILQAWKVVMCHRELLVKYFCQPVWELFIDELVASSKIAVANYASPYVRAAVCRARWIGPPKGSIKEIEEVKAAQIRVSEGFSTLQRECEEMNGSDWLENIEQLGLEQEKKEVEGLVFEPVEVDENDGTKKETGDDAGISD